MTVRAADTQRSARAGRRSRGRPPGATGDATFERVLAAATRLFAEKGYHGTGVAEIGDLAGVARGALYHHIGSKENLLFLLLRRHVAETLEGEEAIALSARAPDEKLRALLAHHVATIAARRDEVAIWVRDAGALTGERAAALQALRERVQRAWSAVVAEGARTGHFRDDDPVLVEGLLGMVNMVYLWFDPAGRLSPEEVAARWADMVLDGLRVGAPRSSGTPGTNALPRR